MKSVNKLLVLVMLFTLAFAGMHSRRNLITVI